MHNEQLVAIIFIIVVYALLYLVDRFLRPRWTQPDGTVIERERQLQSQIDKLRSEMEGIKAQSAEDKRIAIEEATDLRKQIRILVKQNEEYVVKIAGLERQVQDANKRADDLEQQLRHVQQNVEAITPDSRWFRVLGIWPEGLPTLDTQAEANALYNAGFEYRALRGKEANRIGILRELERWKPHLLEVGAHGTEEGIVLSGGDIVRPGWWGNIARQNRQVVAAVLMACRSNQQDRLNTADAMINAGVKHVIAVDEEIPDTDAVQFVSLFYEMLSKGVSFEDAGRRALLAVSDVAREMIVVR